MKTNYRLFPGIFLDCGTTDESVIEQDGAKHLFQSPAAILKDDVDLLCIVLVNIFYTYNTHLTDRLLREGHYVFSTQQSPSKWFWTRTAFTELLLPKLFDHTYRRGFGQCVDSVLWRSKNPPKPVETGISFVCSPNPSRQVGTSPILWLFELTYVQPSISRSAHLILLSRGLPNQDKARKKYYLHTIHWKIKRLPWESNSGLELFIITLTTCANNVFINLTTATEGYVTKQHLRSPTRRHTRPEHYRKPGADIVRTCQRWQSYHIPVENIACKRGEEFGTYGRKSDPAYSS